MKTSNLLRYAAILPLFAIIATGCSKDASLEPQNPVAKVGKISPETNNLSGPVATDLYGSVQVTVQPVDANVSILVYNGIYTSDPYTADGNGFVRIDDIPSGIYTIWVHPNNPNYSDLQISNVRVHETSVNDLGIIKVLSNMTATDR